MSMEQEPYCDFRMTVRIEIPNEPGQFARLATLFAEEGANLGAIDIVEVRRNRMVRDITFDAQQRGPRRAGRRKASWPCPSFRVRSASDRVFLLHLGGKISTAQQGARQDPQHPVDGLHARRGPRLPGHRRGPRKGLRVHHARPIRVAVVSDGSAILGLGNLGPEAAMPVMEGKMMPAQGVRRHRRLAAVPGDAGRRRDRRTRCVAIAPSFGGINLEDISAPRCFEIEERLKASCSTSPSCTTTSTAPPSCCWRRCSTRSRWWARRSRRSSVVVNGLGAAGHGLLQDPARGRASATSSAATARGRCSTPRGDRARGGRARTSAARIDFEHPFATLREALRRGGRLHRRLSGQPAHGRPTCETMARDPIVFAMANPEPEIAPELALPALPGAGDRPQRLSQPGQQPAGVPRHLPRGTRRARRARSTRR